MEVRIDEIEKVAECMPGYTIIYKYDGGLQRLYYSKEVPSLYGYTDEEFLAQWTNPFDLVVESDRPIILEKIHLCVEQKTDVDVSYRVIHKTKSFVWVRSHGRLIGEVDGCPIFVASIFNVSDEMENTSRLLDASDRAIVVFDKNNKEVLYGNSEFFHVAGVPEEQCLGRPCYEVVCGQGSWDEETCICFHALEHNEPMENYNPLTGKYYSILAKEVAWGEHEAIVFYMDDVTEKEKGLRQVKENFESELKIRNELLKEASIYFMANLTKKQILERRFPFPVNDGIQLPCPLNAESWDSNLAGTTLEKYRDEMVAHFSVEALTAAYERGESVVRFEYFRVNDMFSNHWFKAQANLVKQPETGDLIVLIYITDCDEEYKQILARESIVSEEIDFAVLINTEDRMGRLVTATEGLDARAYVDYYNYDEVIERLTVERIAEEHQERCRKAFNLDHVMECLEHEPYYVVSYHHKPENGRKERKQVKAYYLDDAKREIVFSRRDITDLYEEERKHQRELEEAVFAAQKANQAKTDFLSRMSHDIRTPMNAIIGMTELAKQEENPPETKEYLQNIDVSSHFLLGLINDILDLSKIESGEIKLNQAGLPLEDFMRGINTVMKPQMDAKNIQFVTDFRCGLTNVYVDKLRFNQIFFNLLSNAVKFTPENGRIDFTAEEITDADGTEITRFHVRDSGIGMSEEFMEHMYDAFAQEQNNATKTEQGTGLGLPIAKSLVEVMNGSIRALSEVGKGTEFIVDLPLYDVEREDEASDDSRGDEYDLTDMQILLVEDNELNVLVAKKLLEKKGCIVDVATNGLEAVQRFEASEAGAYDVILMDIRMPVMGGLEATSKIRMLERADAASIPIIAMTADAFDEERRKTLESGMNAHLTKPINPAEMYQTIATITARIAK